MDAQRAAPYGRVLAATYGARRCRRNGGCAGACSSCRAPSCSATTAGSNGGSATTCSSAAPVSTALVRDASQHRDALRRARRQARSPSRAGGSRACSARRNGWPLGGARRRRLAGSSHCIVPAPRGRATELQLVVFALAIGPCGTARSAQVGLDLRSPAGTADRRLAPAWILALWALFATTLTCSSRWLKNSLLGPRCFGALGGPLSYWAGMRLGALQFAAPSPALVALSYRLGRDHAAADHCCAPLARLRSRADRMFGFVQLGVCRACAACGAILALAGSPGW